jgi:hypothetical protein
LSVLSEDQVSRAGEEPPSPLRKSSLCTLEHRQQPVPLGFELRDRAVSLGQKPLGRGGLRFRDSPDCRKLSVPLCELEPKLGYLFTYYR